MTFTTTYTPLPQTPKGCICPPTSEATCQRPDCGRKPSKKEPNDAR